MGADSTSFLTVLSMGLFTVLSIVVGYIMLNSAIGDQVAKSAYYGFSRFVGLMESAFEKNSASMADVYFYPQYVIFMAYFGNIEDIEYYSFEGQRLNDIAVNQDSNLLFDQIIKSSSLDTQVLQSVNDEKRKELIKCVGQSCICFGQMNSFLFVEEEYIVPNACVDICWGENPTSYRSCVAGKTGEPKTIMRTCNNEAKNNDGMNGFSSPKCRECVEFMENSNNFVVKDGGEYNILTLKVSQGVNKNSDTYLKLKDFSTKTKFSFIPVVIECVTLESIAESSKCGGAPHLMKYGNELFSIFTTSKIQGDIQKSNHVLFDLFTLNYEQNDLFSPDTCYLSNDYIKSGIFTVGEES